MNDAAMTGPQALRRGLWLGLIGVVIFAATVPLTRLAVGTPEAPHMSSVFVALARAALAGSLSALYLLATARPGPVGRTGCPWRWCRWAWCSAFRC